MSVKRYDKRTIDRLLKELGDNLKKIKKKFISVYLEEADPDPLSGPEVFELDVKAFCVFAHAFIEDYLERIALEVMERSVDEYIYKKKLINPPLLTLVKWHNKGFNINNHEMEAEIKTFDVMKDALDKIKQNYSMLLNGNHGISKKYVRNIFIPLSIDISDNPDWNSALAKLANERGSYAHKMVNRIINPQEANEIVEYCLEFCRDIGSKAKKLF